MNTDETKENTYKRQISDALARINWRLIDAGCGYYRFANQNGEQQPIVFYYDRITLDDDRYGGRFSVCFYMKDIMIDFYSDGRGVGFRGRDNSNIFLNCYNFN